MKLVFDVIENQTSSSSSISKALSEEEGFLICLVKLKMNYPFKDIANHLNVFITLLMSCMPDSSF